METKSAIDLTSATPKREANPLFYGMVAMLVMVMGAAGFFGWRSVNAEREIRRLHQEVDGLMAELEQQAQGAKRDKAALQTAHQEEVDRLQSEMKRLQAQWAERQKEWERRDEEQRKQMQRSFEALASVVNDSGSALDYLREMEAKVRKGQTLQKQEMDDLKVIGKGLAILQSQYKRPLEEFKSLEESIEKELQDAAAAPSEEKKFLRAMFDWRYRERQKAERLKELGRREALEDTQQELAQRYAKAQQEMAAVGQQFAAHLAKLDAVVGSDNADADEMASFFEVSSEVIKIHQRVMNTQAEPVPPSQMPVVSGSEIKP